MKNVHVACGSFVEGLAGIPVACYVWYFTQLETLLIEPV